MQNESLFRDKPVLIRMIVPCGTGGGDVGEVFQNFHLQDIYIQGIFGLFKKLVDVLFVVAQSSLTDFLSLFQGEKFIGNLSQSAVIADHFRSHILHVCVIHITKSDIIR